MKFEDIKVKAMETGNKAKNWVVKHKKGIINTVILVSTGYLVGRIAYETGNSTGSKAYYEGYSKGLDDGCEYYCRTINNVFTEHGLDIYADYTRPPFDRGVSVFISDALINKENKNA